MKRLILAVLVTLFCLLANFRAFAQLGYGIPQTIQIRALNGVTTPTTFVVPNVGQSIHYLQYSISGGNTCAQLFVGLEGSNDGTSFFQISEIATDSPTGGVYASGYFPVVRVNLFAIGVCGGGTLTAFYSATSSGFGTPLGIFGQSGGLRKVIAQLQPVNTPVSPTIGVPLGSVQGRIYLGCFTAVGVATACPAGGTLTVSAIPSAEMTPIPIFSNPIATVSTTQFFDISGGAANNVKVTWSGFAASAATLTAYYQFSAPGSTSPVSGAIAAISQPTASKNQESSSLGAAVTITLAPISSTVHLYALQARCSAGTATLTITDGGTQIWSFSAVGTVSTIQTWPTPLRTLIGNNMVITLGSCGGGNTGTLSIQASIP